jgi:hypothetical protein
LPSAGPTARIVYRPSQGTGYVLKEVGIFSVRNRRIERLWRHKFFESAFVVPDAPGTVETYDMRIEPDGAIFVTGVRQLFAPGTDDTSVPTSREALPERSFCWEPSRSRYVTCPR